MNNHEFNLEEFKAKETPLQCILKEAERRRNYHGFGNRPGYKNKK